MVLHHSSSILCLLSCKDTEVSQQYVSLGFFTIQVKVTTSCRVKKVTGEVCKLLIEAALLKAAF